MENDFYSALAPEDRIELQSLLKRRTFARDEVVFHQGDPGGAIHIIESGWFLVQLLTPGGDRVGMTIEGPGDMFGELALLRPERRRTATIRALRPAVTQSLDAERFEFLRVRKPEIDRFLVALLARRVDRLSTQLAEAAWTSADLRVRRQIRRLHDVFDADRIYLKQSEVASLAHTTRPTVSSVLSQLARDGIITNGRGWIQVKDLARLELSAMSVAS